MGLLQSKFLQCWTHSVMRPLAVGGSLPVLCCCGARPAVLFWFAELVEACVG